MDRKRSHDSGQGIALQHENKKELNVDDFLHLVGDYGKFQKTLNVIFGLMEIPYIFVIYILTFTAFEPEWRCAENSTVCSLNGTFTSENNFRCHIPRSEWEYLQPKEYSIVVEYDLSCGGEWLISLSVSIIFVGALFGAVILTWVSDNFGRKKLMFISYTAGTIANFASCLMPNMSLFIMFRFFSGFFMPGANVFVMIIETVGEKHRAFAGNLIWLFYAVALCLLPLKAYFISSWKLLFVAGSLPYLVFVATYQFVPESVRWLRLKSRTKDALAIFQRMAKWNGRVLDPTVTLSPVSKEKEITNPLDVFRPKQMAMTSIVFIFCFYTNSLVYFGLTMTAGDLGSGSLHLNFVLMSLVEFPAALLATYCCDKFGRKKSSTFPLALSGLLVVTVSLLPITTQAFRMVRTITGIFAKLFITMSYDCIATLVVEAYPTNIRSEALGIMGVAATIGGASAPWVAKGLSTLVAELPFYVMGTLGVVAGVSCYLLPETKGTLLRESKIDFQLVPTHPPDNDDKEARQREKSHFESTA
eukprot:TCONS_00019771-protein